MSATGFSVAVKFQSKSIMLHGFYDSRPEAVSVAQWLRNDWKGSRLSEHPTSIRVRKVTEQEWETSRRNWRMDV